MTQVLLKPHNLQQIRQTGTFPADVRWHHDRTAANRADLAADASIVRPVRGGTRGHLKARLVKDPSVKALLEKAHVEVYSDLPKPKSGHFARLIEQELLVRKPIPRPAVKAAARSVIASSPRSIGKPGLGTAGNVGLGILISLVEADVADTFYRDSTALLNHLLHQMVENGDGNESEWRQINERLNEIANMKQSWLGHAWELITYGQGSLQEWQGKAMMQLAWELAETYDYENEKTWTELMNGQLGRYKKKR